MIFIGDCAKWKGQLFGQEVSVESLYADRSTKDPHQAKHADIFAKLAEVTRLRRAARGQPYLRLSGCPTSVSEQVLLLVQHAKLKNPILHRAHAINFNAGYLAWRSATAVKRAFGKKYQSSGPYDRGAAKPEL